MKAAKTLAIIGLIGLLISTLAMAQGPEGERGGPPRFGGPEAANQGPMERGPRGHRFGLSGLPLLDLTEEQHDQIKAIEQENQDKMKTTHQAVLEAHKALHEAVMDGEDEEAILIAANTLGQAIGEEAVAQAMIIQAIKATLTQEQLQKLEEIKDQPPQGMRPPRSMEPEGPTPE